MSCEDENERENRTGAEEPTTPTTHSQMNVLFDERRRELLADAEKRAQQKHVQRLHKKRTLQQSIDECLAEDTELHHKATGLRLAFEEETELWQAKINEVSRHLIMDLKKTYSPEFDLAGGSSSRSFSETLLESGPETSPFIYSFDEQGQPIDPPVDSLYHPCSVLSPELFISDTSTSLLNAHPCSDSNCRAHGNRISEPLHLHSEVAAVPSEVRASKRARKFISPVKANTDKFI